MDEQVCKWITSLGSDSALGGTHLFLECCLSAGFQDPEQMFAPTPTRVFPKA